MIVRSKAPLRVGFAGGGTDVDEYCQKYGGYVLNAAIDLYAHCTIELTQDNSVEFHAVDIDQHFESNIMPNFEIDDILPFHKAVYNRMTKDYNNGTPLSIKVTTYIDVPGGSGLGSSSALVVAIIRAFAELLTIPLDDYQIADLAYIIERKDLNCLGGRQDQYAAAFGGINFIVFQADGKVIVKPLRVRSWIKDELENSIVLYDTGTSRNGSDIFAKQTNHINVLALDKIKGYAFLMKEALLKGEFRNVAAILDESWAEKKRTSDQIANARINNIYDTAKRAGALAGKLSGAGGGGFMWFIVDPVRKYKVTDALLKCGGKVLNAHFVAQGARGWKVL